MLAVLHKKKGEYEKAMELYYKALAIVERTFGSNHPTVGLYIKTIGKIVFRSFAFPPFFF